MKSKRLKVIIHLTVPLLLALTALFVSLHICNTAESGLWFTHALERWNSDERYACAGVYFEAENGLSNDAVTEARQGILAGLTEAALTPQSEGSRLSVDCFSGELNMSAEYGDTALEVRACIFGGDFFYLHSPEYLSGFGFDDSEDFRSCAVIDEYTAWRLFRALDVCGMEFYIGDYPFRVTGVISAKQAPDGGFYGDKPRIYINRYGAKMLGADTVFTSYEILLPSPVNGFATELMKKQFGESADVRSLNERFGIKEMAAAAGELRSSFDDSRASLVPFWESEARMKLHDGIAASLVVLASLAFIILYAAAAVIAAVIKRRTIFMSIKNIVNKRRNTNENT